MSMVDRIMSMTDEKIFICPYCDAEYKTKEGLAKHLKKCEAKPDDEVEPAPGAGIPLYSKPAPAPKDEDEDEDDECICPECGYTAKYEFPVCPKCGVELEWD